MSNATQALSQNQPQLTQAVPWTSVLPSTAFFEDMVAVLGTHCVMTDEEVDAIAFWVTASYSINEFRIFPKLTLVSPEKRCGKTTTLEVIGALANQPVMVSNISSAAIYRATVNAQPTLIIDEADRFIANGEPALIGIINSGHTRSAATVVKCNVDSLETQQFSTWMPMVLASIGSLQDTIMDRSLVIKLRRKKSNEHVKQIPPDLKDQLQPVRKALADWTSIANQAMANAQAEPPDVGNDRAQDNWLAMFKVAEVLGGSYLGRCETAYRSLTAAEELELPTQLLSDIRAILLEGQLERIGSSDLISKLTEDATKPWVDFSYGRAITASKVAKMLAPYGISPQSYRAGEKTLRGYLAKQFIDAFERYLPPV